MNQKAHSAMEEKIPGMDGLRLFLRSWRPSEEPCAFELPAPDFALAVYKGLGRLALHAHVLHLKNADFSRDARAVQALNDDPLIADETQPTQTVAARVRADERLKKAFPQITLPLLILYGTADKAANP